MVVHRDALCAAFSMRLVARRASFAGSISGGAMTGGLVTAAASAGGLDTPDRAVAAAAEAADAAGSCSVQGVLPVVAIAPAESVT